jgi:hypothetical protein
VEELLFTSSVELELPRELCHLVVVLSAGDIAEAHSSTRDFMTED